MALFKLSDLSEEERKKYLQDIGLDPEKYKQIQEDKNTNNKKSENDVNLPITQKNNNTPVWQPILQRNATNVDTSKNKTNEKTILPPAQKNNSVFQDIVGVAKNFLSGASAGVKQMGNYIENANEQNSANYKNVREEQFLLSQKVDGLDKSSYKSQNNFVTDVLLKNDKTTDSEDKIETNLVKKYIQNSIQEDNEKIALEQEKMSNGVTKVLGELAPSIGQMGVGMVANAVNPALGTGYFLTSAGGSYSDEAKQRGMTDKQAFQFGTIMGGVESVTELVGLESFKKAGTGLKALITGSKGVEKEVAKTSLKTIFKDYGIGIADNFIQEAIIDPIQEVVASKIGGEDKANWENMGQQMLEDGIKGALVSMITGGIGIGIKSCTSVGEKLSNGKKVSQTEYKQAIQDAVNNGVKPEDSVADGVNQSIYKNTILSNLNTSTLSDKTKTELQQYLKENKITEEQYNQIDEMLQMSKEEKTNTNDNITKYQFVKSDNAKVNQLRQDIANNTNWDNSKETQNYVNMLEKIITDKDIDIRLDSNLVDENGNLANGSYKDGTITINPNSDRYGEFLAVHELTHAIGTDTMRNMVQKYRESNLEFNSEVEKLLGTYKSTELNDEALADISGQLFGNQEFINNIANTNPSFFRKIYNEIKYLWHQFRGYKNQDQFVDDLYNKWTEAYNSTNKLNTENKYHISENFSNEIDKALSNQLSSNTQVKARDFTPKILVENGVSDLPMLITQKHIKSTIYTSQEAQKLGLPTKNINYHGLGKDLLMKAIDNLDNPQAIYKINDNNYLVVTEFTDNNGKEIIVPIQIDGKGNYNDVYIDENQIKSVYGRNNLHNYIKNNNFEQIYNKNKATTLNEGIQYSDISSASNNSIQSTQKNVNDTTKYSMQESEKNNQTWRKYLEDNFKPSGTRTDMSKLPIDNRIIENRKQEIINKAQQIEKINSDFRGLTDEIKDSYLGKDFDYDRYKQMNEYLDSLKPIEKENNQTQQILPINKVEKVNENTPGETVDYAKMERPNGKIRKHYRSIIESSNTTAEAKKIAKELMGVDTYVGTSNKHNTEIADRNIEQNGVNESLTTLTSKVNNNDKITAVDIATGERLIEYFSKIGDKERLQEAIQTTAMAGTEAGQAVQAMSLLNHQTPQGQATWIQRSVDKMNNELAKRKGGIIKKDEEGNVKVVNKKGQDITHKVNLFNLTPDMINKIVSSKNKTEMYNNIDQVYEDLGQQVPLSTMEKIDSWRYFSMLANPKTHIRNIVGNVAMGKTQSIKDKLAGGIEDIVGTFNKDMERTKTLKRADSKTKEFAKNDVLNPDVQSMMELNENKYNPQSRLQNARKTFKNDTLENTLGRLFNWNDKLLEAEDALGLKSNYKKALANYLTANKIDVDNITDKQLSKARNYAVEQAKEATFHQANSIATAINQFSKKNGLTKGFTDAVLPFVKTPLNVAKAGLGYNPTGLLKTITYDTIKLRKGEITVNKYIDNLSKGLTGTGIAVLGYALADAGILKASGGDDDDKETYEEQQGKQSYSIQIGDKTYSLDWLTPVGIPLFVGAEAKALINSQKEEKSSISSDDNKKYNQALKSLENLTNAVANSMSPMAEMSMISGLTSALQSYENDSAKMFGTMGMNAVKSYVNQFVPTVLGQTARTTDDYDRSTTSTKSGVLSKAIDQTKLQVMSKIPGLRQMLPVATDVWGNEKEQKGNIIDNAILPWTKKEITTNSTDKVLTELYDKTGENTVLPDSYINKTLTYDKQKYRLTDQEYAELKKEYGQTSYAIVSGLTKSKEFNKMSEEQQVKAVSEAYKYSKAKIKATYANWNDIDTEDSSVYKKVQSVINNGGDAKDYFLYVGATTNIEKQKDKIRILKNSSIGSKNAIYASTIGSDDKTYSILNNTEDLNINNYLDFKLQDFSSDKEDDGTINGKTISGSAKNKFYDYMDSSDFTYEQKLLLTGMKYKVTNSERENIFDIVNNFELSADEKLKIMSKMQGFTVYNNGKVTF